MGQIPLVTVAVSQATWHKAAHIIARGQVFLPRISAISGHHEEQINIGHYLQKSKCSGEKQACSPPTGMPSNLQFQRCLPETECFHREILILLLKVSWRLTHDNTRYNVQLQQKSEKETEERIKVTLTRKRRPELSSPTSWYRRLPAMDVVLLSSFLRTVFLLLKVWLAGMVT